ncbi:hypothetical protein BSNK01_22140 [Bacillaceae bacterium]
MKENLTVAKKIIGMLEHKEVISEDMKEKIDTLVQEKEQILNVQIYKMEDVKRETENGIISYHTNEAIPTYQYGKAESVSQWTLIDLDTHAANAAPSDDENMIFAV